MLGRLIPIRQTEWPYVHEQLLPGTEVVVRVHKINDFPKYRWVQAGTDDSLSLALRVASANEHVQYCCSQAVARFAATMYG